MSVRAKFICRQVDLTGETARIGLDPVIDGSAENKEFYKWTPGGHIDLQVVSHATAARFTQGAAYYVDFTAEGQAAAVVGEVEASAVALLQEVRAWRNAERQGAFPHELRERIDALVGTHAEPQ